MKVYIAGPMRGIPQFNFPAFDKAAAWLETLGHDVFSPAAKDRETHGDTFGADNATGDEAIAAVDGFNLRAALGADLAWITEHADAVAVLDGWENSAGARAEVATALALGLLVYPWGDFIGTEFDRTRDQFDDYPDRITAVPGETVADATPTTGEVRTTSSSGGEKGSKLARFDLIPAVPLWTLAELYGAGATKYADRNWERGYDWSLSYAALMRHASLFWQGIDLDNETGKPHLASVAWHAFALMEWATTHPEYDNRPVKS